MAACVFLVESKVGKKKSIRAFGYSSRLCGSERLPFLMHIDVCVCTEYAFLMYSNHSFDPTAIKPGRPTEMYPDLTLLLTPLSEEASRPLSSMFSLDREHG